MTKRIAIYARVSTDEQTVDNQLIELRSLCDRLGYTIVQEYTDSGISGAKSRNDRPALDALMKDATRRRFDMVMCWSIDRLGRSLQHLVEILNGLQALGIDLYFQQQGMDTSTPSGRMIFSVFGAIGEFERNLIRERVLAGQQRAKANGVKLGRPSKMNALMSVPLRGRSACGTNSPLHPCHRPNETGSKATHKSNAAMFSATVC
ncbi:MAG: recombinase family protein [Oxalobacteraceae bacterium]|nr:recombinase family protein [Oxalobacteraceae bacterium]